MDIVDEFVVTLGLDPSSYKKEMGDFRDDLRRTKEETRRTTRDMESDGRRAAESFNRLKNELVGLFLVAAGGASLTGLIRSLIHGAAETGRFGQMIGMATERVSVWEMAIVAMGGSAEEARAGLAALNAEYTNYMLTGRAVHDADLAALGISANDLQSPEQLALALAERRSAMTQREFSARLQRLGLPDSFIRTLARGRDGVRELLDEQERLGPVTEEQSRTAQQAEREWANLTHQLRSELRPALTWLLESGFPILRSITQSVTTDIRALTVAFTQLGQVGNSIGDFFRSQWLNFRMLRLESQLLNTPDTPQNRSQREALIRERESIRAEQAAIARRSEEPWATAENIDSIRGGGGGRGAGPSSRVMNYEARARGFPSVPADVRTLGQASDFALRVNRSGARSSAMGTYQIVGQTLRQYAPRVFGANWRNTAFDDSAQERIAEAIFNDHRGSAAALRGQWVSLSSAAAERVRRMPWSQARHEIARGESGGSGGGRWAQAARQVFGGSRTAVRSRGGAGGTNVSVGTVNVYTPPGTTGRQAEAVAEAIPRAVQRKGVVTQANGGLQ